MIIQKCYITVILSIHLFVLNLKVEHSFANATKLEKLKNERQIISHCKDWQFHCKSGQCIAKSFVCDGLKDCKDNSDETHDQCQNETLIKCNKKQFQCQYGACIEKKYQCDGLKQCTDGSDESPDMCNLFHNHFKKKRTKRDADKSCTAPASSPDKTIEYVCSKKPPSETCGPKNGYLPEWTIATINCTSGYYRDNSEIGPIHTCYNSQWSPKITKCVKKCDKLNPVNVVLHCYRNGLHVGNCDGDSILLAGTVVRPVCKSAYKYEFPPSYYEITCNDDGKWDNNLFSCIPECGKPYTAPLLTIAGGTPETFGGYPWHVAIFNREKILICGGTIISETLVLSAAHCFSDGNNCEGTDCIEDFEVVIGKHTSNYTIQDNSYQRTMKIKEIRFPKKGYHALNTYYAGDIAILILKKKIPISPAILPACLNWMDLKNGKYPSENEPGKVFGWGRTENGNLSTVLRSINLPFISYKRCVSMVNDDFKPFVTFDKFCAGTGNHTGPTLMDGDSGGGLLFEENNLFYLRGIASVKQYSSNSLTVFTDLTEHIDWIASVRALNANFTFAISEKRPSIPGESPISSQSYDSHSLHQIKTKTASASNATDTLNQIYNSLWETRRDISLLQQQPLSLDIKALVTVVETNVSNLQKSTDLEAQEIRQQNKGVTLKLQELFQSLVKYKADLDIMVKKVLPDEAVRDIRADRFSEAEEKLQRLNSNSEIKFVVRMVYNNQEGNFNLLLRFGKSIQNDNCRIEVLKALYVVMKDSGNFDSWKLMRLGQTAAGVRGIGTSFNFTDLWDVVLYAEIVKPIVDSVLSGSSYSMPKQKSTSQDYCFLCLVNIYEHVIPRIWGKMPIWDIFSRAQADPDYLEGHIAVQLAVFNFLGTDIYNQNAITLARNIKNTMANTKYKDAHPEAKLAHEMLKNGLPESVKNLVFASVVCLKNMEYNEHLFVSERIGDKNHYVYTRPPRPFNDRGREKWQVAFSDHQRIDLSNQKYSECFYASARPGAYNMLADNVRRNVYTWTGDFPYTGCGTNFSDCVWDVEVDGHGIQLINVWAGEYLYADHEKGDEGKRSVFTYVPKGRTKGSQWNVTDCSNY